MNLLILIALLLTSFLLYLNIQKNQPKFDNINNFYRLGYKAREIFLRYKNNIRRVIE